MDNPLGTTVSARKILCIDFDGVIHSYTSGWKGQYAIHDPVVPGFFEWAIKARHQFNLVIYSSRSSSLAGIDAMRRWLVAEWSHWAKREHPECEIFADTETLESSLNSWENLKLAYSGGPLLRLYFSEKKPPAWLTIDDRAWSFDGTWPDPKLLLLYKTWQQMTPEDYAAFRGWSQKPNGDVVLTMTPDDWAMLLETMGRGLSTFSLHTPEFADQLRLLNRLNAGNPNWTPYQIPEETPQ